MSLRRVGSRRCRGDGVAGRAVSVGRRDSLLEVVELAVHLQHRDVVAQELVGAVGELDARVGAGQLLAAGRPLDRGALVEEVAGVEVGLPSMTVTIFQRFPTRNLSKIVTATGRGEAPCPPSGSS